MNLLPTVKRPCLFLEMKRLARGHLGICDRERWFLSPHTIRSWSQLRRAEISQWHLWTGSIWVMRCIFCGFFCSLDLSKLLKPQRFLHHELFLVQHSWCVTCCWQHLTTCCRLLPFATSLLICTREQLNSNLMTKKIVSNCSAVSPPLKVPLAEAYGSKMCFYMKVAV